MYFIFNVSYFFFHITAPPEIYTLSLHDALPIYRDRRRLQPGEGPGRAVRRRGAGEGKITVCADSSPFSSLPPRSEEHTSELQSRFDLVCRLLLEKKKKNKYN